MLENGDVWMGKTTHIERKLFKWRKTAWEQERQEIIKTLKRYKPLSFGKFLYGQNSSIII